MQRRYAEGGRNLVLPIEVEVRLMEHPAVLNPLPKTSTGKVGTFELRKPDDFA
jgi:hypothetical protein